MDDEIYRNFLGITGLGLAFVIDTTGSMAPYIQGAIDKVKHMIDFLTKPYEKPSHYILVEFNDPGYGPVYKTTNPDELKNRLNSLKATGSGNIKEMGLHGIFLAAQAAEVGSKIFVFTDAPPKDHDLLNQVHALAQEKDLSIFFELGAPKFDNDQKALPPSNNPIIIDFVDYFNLAKFTEGLVIETTGSKEDAIKCTKISETFLRTNTVIIYRHHYSKSMDPVSIPVDNTIIDLLITVTTSTPCIKNVMLRYPDKKTFDTSRSQLTPTAYLVIVDGANLVVGNWELTRELPHL